MDASSPLLNSFLVLLLAWFFAGHLKSSDLASTKDSGGRGRSVHEVSSNLVAKGGESSGFEIESSLSTPDASLAVIATLPAPPGNSAFCVRCPGGLYTFSVPELARKGDVLLLDGLVMDLDVNVEIFPLFALLPVALE